MDKNSRRGFLKAAGVAAVTAPIAAAKAAQAARMTEKHKEAVVTLTYTHMSMKPRTLVVPPDWFEGEAFWYVCEVRRKEAYVRGYGDVEAEMGTWWAKNKPSLKQLDEAWKTHYAKAACADILDFNLPKELRQIAEDIIKKGPHHVTAPDAHFQILADLLSTWADREANRCETLFDTPNLRANARYAPKTLVSMLRGQLL